MTNFHDLIHRMAAELDHYRQLVTDDRREVHPLAVEARALLATSVTSPPDWRGLCEELVEALDGWHKAVFETGTSWARPDETYLLDRARAALAQPEPEVVGPTLQLPEQAPDEHPPSNLDRREVAAWYHGHGCGWQAARTALAAEADGPAVQSREPASVVGEPSDEEIMELMPPHMHEDFAFAARAMANEAGTDSQNAKGFMRIALNRHAVDLARAVLARYGHQPAPPAEGEVAELVAALELEADAQDPATELQWATHDQLRRAADLLERLAAPVPEPALARINGILSDSGRVLLTDVREALELAREALQQHQAASVPVASDTRYEFSVLDTDFTEQAGGTAPTYAQALSEGQHYLAQYQQDGPHTLEVRRVENLNPGAFPVPDDAPVPVLPEDAQAIEPIERTIMVPAPVPVAVSVEREGAND